MNNSVLAQLAALPEQNHARAEADVARSLRQRAAALQRRFLVKRLAYRIQELEYGGLSARAEAKLSELVEEEDGGSRASCRCARATGRSPARG